jgi:N utilization substance protein B
MKKRGKPSRKKARELLVQAIYQWLLTQYAPEAIVAQFRESPEWAAVDTRYFEEGLTQIVQDKDRLYAYLHAVLDRPIAQLSTVEHAILLLGTWEIVDKADIPNPVSIHEAVELAKRYGSAEGYRYVNGVLDKIAKQHA